MDELKDYLTAREHIKEFYEYVVWVKLEKKIVLMFMILY